MEKNLSKSPEGYIVYCLQHLYIYFLFVLLLVVLIYTMPKYTLYNFASIQKKIVTFRIAERCTTYLKPKDTNNQKGWRWVWWSKITHKVYYLCICLTLYVRYMIRTAPYVFIQGVSDCKKKIPAKYFVSKEPYFSHHSMTFYYPLQT